MKEKEKTMKVFEIKDYKPKSIASPCNDKYIKYNSESNEELNVAEYFENSSYLHDMIDHLKESDKWKILVLSESDSKEIMRF